MPRNLQNGFQRTIWRLQRVVLGDNAHRHPSKATSFLRRRRNRRVIRRFAISIDPYSEPTLEHFTGRARRALVLAQEEACLRNHNFIGTEHILLGLIHEGEGIAAKALESLDISLDAAREEVAKTIGYGGSASTRSPPFTPRSKKVLELSFGEALQLGHDQIDTAHMLLGLVREGEGVAARVLVNLGADLGRVRQRVIGELSRFHEDDAE